MNGESVWWVDGEGCVVGRCVCGRSVSMCFSQVGPWTDMVLCRRKFLGGLQLL